MSSPYLDLPSRSEAEAILDRVANIRAKVVAIDAYAKEQLALLGENPDDLKLFSIVDAFDEMVCGIEKEAKSAIEEAQSREEFEHESVERGLLMAHLHQRVM